MPAMPFRSRRAIARPERVAYDTTDVSTVTPPHRATMGFGDYLSASELADLVGCERNQRAMMIRWLVKNRWKYVLDKHDFPKVMRSYRNHKLGLTDDRNEKATLDSSPNLEAFSALDKGRNKAVQTRRRSNNVVLLQAPR